MEFDEDLAVEFIRNQMPDDAKTLYDDDEILNVIDIIWDYYEDNGMLDITDDDTDDNVDLDALVSHVKSVLKKDKQATVRESDIPYIVKGELAYEASLEL